MRSTFPRLIDLAAVKHALRIRTATPPDCAVGPEVLVDSGDLVVVPVTVRHDLASSAERFSRWLRGRMPVLGKDGSQVAILGLVPETFTVEHMAQFERAHKYNERLRCVCHV